MKLNRHRVLELMHRQGINTQMELAERVGVTRQSLSSWLHGGTFTLDNLSMLCDVLKCTPNDVLILGVSPKEKAPIREMVNVPTP